MVVKNMNPAITMGFDCFCLCATELRLLAAFDMRWRCFINVLIMKIMLDSTIVPYIMYIMVKILLSCGHEPRVTMIFAQTLVNKSLIFEQ